MNYGLFAPLPFRPWLIHPLCLADSPQARREPQRGPGKHSRGAPKHFHGAFLGRKFLYFSFQNGTFWRTLYFWPTAGPPNVAGPGVVNPLYPTLLMGLIRPLACSPLARSPPGLFAPWLICPFSLDDSPPIE